jgi:hypothetical protein
LITGSIRPESEQLVVELSLGFFELNKLNGSGGDNEGQSRVDPAFTQGIHALAARPRRL